MTTRRWIMPSLLALVVLLAIASIVIGRIVLGWNVWLDQDAIGRTILLELRLPRALLGVAIGAALGLAGAAMQGYLRNPLADPGTLGVSSMAAFGAVLSIFFGIADLHPWILPAERCRRRDGRHGRAVPARRRDCERAHVRSVRRHPQRDRGRRHCTVLSLSPSPWAAGEIVRWLLGALADRSLDDLLISTPLIAIGAVLILGARQALDALTLGEAGARSLGIDLGRAQWQLAGGVGLVVGASVAVSGIIGFVGLVVPHLLRPLVGREAIGAAHPSAVGARRSCSRATSWCDCCRAARKCSSASMSLIGAPFFFALLYSMRRQVT